MDTHYRVSDKVSLEVNQNKNQDYVPVAKPIENNEKVMEQIAIAIGKKMPVLLIGETGTGKTSIVRWLAQQTNNGFRRVNHNGGTEASDLKGRILLKNGQTVWVDGVLVEAMKHGLWYLADEINATGAEINFLYHSLLDDDGFIVLEENNGEIVKPHENFRFFASMNPPDYAGTKELNKALMSRFVVVKVDYPEPNIEASILHHRTGIPMEKAEALVAFASGVRANYVKQVANFTVSTRDLLQFAELYMVFGKYIPAGEVAVLNKANTDSFQTTKDLLALHFADIDAGKAKEKSKPKAKQEPETPMFCSQCGTETPTAMVGNGKTCSVCGVYR